MIDKEEARELVAQKLSVMSTPADPFGVVDSYTIEREFGWVFFYNSKRYLDTGDPSSRLAGNGPVIVNKHDGSVLFFGSNRRTLAIIEEYERKWLDGRGET